MRPLSLSIQMRVVFSVIFMSVLLLLNTGSLSHAGNDRGEGYAPDHQQVADRFHKKQSAMRAQEYVDSTRDWLEENGYSTELLFIADMSLHMNLKRFYVVNPDSQKLLNSFLVAHGSGGKSTVSNAVFSNVPGSYCSSQGRYRIGETYDGKFGRSYRLHGLDASNSNAYDRSIVFHAFLDQTDKEYGTPNYFSSGCPMVSHNAFDYCDSLIQLQDKPVMLVIYK